MTIYRKHWIIFGLLYLFSLIPRLYQLGQTSIHMDEVIWMINGKEFVYALFHLNLAYFQSAWWNNTQETYAIGLPAVFITGLSHIFLSGQSKFSLHLFSDIVASRLPIALISALLPSLIYHYLKKINLSRIGLVSALTYSLSSVSLNLDRWLLHDSFLNLFSFLAIITFLISAYQRRISALPGIWLALAFLSKPPGLLAVVPWIAILLFSYQRSTLKLFMVNIFSSLMAILIFWPASWFAPVTSILNYLKYQLTFTQTGFVNFYLGRVTTDPGPSYYFFQIFTKTPEIILVGIMLGMVYGLHRLFIKNNSKIALFKFLLPVSLYLISFWALISFSIAKPGIRYALPIFPWLYILSGYGLVNLYSSIKTKTLKLVVIFLSLISLIYPLTYFPEYQMNYNLFIGGARGASKYDRVSLCVGHRQALLYIDQHQLSDPVYVYGCTEAARYATSKRVTLDLTTANLFVVETHLSQLYPDDIKLSYITSHANLITDFSHAGVITAQLYQRR